ncbi:hypothetical protein MMC28_008275 [Mycoblastus sanguinarius]|nr:hypothetical protein [Mycoblastus sanguinarius]
MASDTNAPLRPEDEQAVKKEKAAKKEANDEENHLVQEPKPGDDQDSVKLDLSFRSKSQSDERVHSGDKIHQDVSEGRSYEGSSIGNCDEAPTVGNEHSSSPTKDNSRGSHCHSPLPHGSKPDDYHNDYDDGEPDFDDEGDHDDYFEGQAGEHWGRHGYGGWD